MPLTPTTTQNGLSFPNATQLAGALVAEFADGEWAYTSDTKTTWRLDRSATQGGVPAAGGYGRWVPFVPTPPPPSGVSMTLIYQPSGVAAGNVYTDPWLLYNAIIAAGGIVDVYVDCSLDSPALWPVDQPIAGARFHQSPETPTPATMATTAGTNPNTGLPTQGLLYNIALLDGVMVMNAGSAAVSMVRVGGSSSGTTFMMTNGASIQRASDGDILALTIDADPAAPSQLTINDCVNPFPNLGDGGAWNVQFNGGIGSMLNVLLTIGGPSFHLPTFSAGPGPILNLFYDDTIPSSQLGEGAWQGTVNFIPLSALATTGVWYVDISGKYGGAGPGTTPIGNGTPGSPFNLVQSALTAIDAAARAALLPGGFQYSGYLVQITEGFSSESLSLPADSPVNSLTIQGSGTNATGIGSNAGVCFSWVLGAPAAGGQSPSNVTFQELSFNTEDLVSDTIHLDASGAPPGNGGFSNVQFTNVSIDNAGGNPGGTGTPLFLKSCQVVFTGNQNDANVNANGNGTAAIRLWNSQLNVSGPQVNIGLIQHCADYRAGAPPIGGGLSIMQCQGGAQIGNVQSRGTPVLFIGDGGQVGSITSQSLDPSPATGFATNVAGPWVGGTTQPGTLGPGAENIGPVIGLQGQLGSLLGPGNASLVTFADMTAFPAPFLGPAFFVIPGGVIAGTLDVETADPAGFFADWSGVKLFSNLVNGIVPSFTAGNGVAINLNAAAFQQSWLHTTGTGRFLFGPGFWNAVTPVTPSTYDAKASDWIQFPANTVGATVINLPDATVATEAIRISKGGTGSVQVFSTGGQNIFCVVAGPTTNFFVPDSESLTLEPSGGAWWRTASSA